MIINLISGPRNISTALMYSFAQRKDTKVLDEPFYAYYLLQTGLDHPGRDETIANLESDPEKIMRQITDLEKIHENVFLKNMAHHHEGLDWTYLINMKNVFLIRDPKQLIASFAQVITHPTLQDIGLKYEAELFDFVCSNGKYPTVVIDSNSILPDPEKGLKALCGKVGIEFDKSMLSWEKGPIQEDGTWAKYWYQNVHNSTGFQKQKTSERELPDRCLELYAEALPYYNKLISHIN